MSEENKNTLTPENVGKEQTDSGQSDEKLNEELEQLRETFQNTYNETAKNAEEDDGEPVIQGLDYSGDTDDDGGDGDRSRMKRKKRKSACRAGISRASLS